MICSSYKQILSSFVATFNKWFTSTLLPTLPLLWESWFNDFFKSSSQTQNLPSLTSHNHKQKQFKIIEQNTTLTQWCFNKEHKSLHSTQHITKITCLDACWFVIVVESPASRRSNEQHHETQSTKTMLQLIPSMMNTNPTRPSWNHHEPPPT